MVYRLQRTYDENVDILDVNYIAGSTKVYTLPLGICKNTDINSMLNSALPKDLKVNITIDDIKLKSYLTTNNTIRFTKRSFSM